MSILLRILRYMRPYWRRAVLTYLAMILVTLLSLISPGLIGNAVDAALGAENTSLLFSASWDREQVLVATAVLIVALAVVRGFGSFLQRYGMQWLGRQIAYDIRMDLFSHLQRLPFSFYDRTRVGQLMSRGIGDIDEIRFFAGVVIGDIINLVVLLTGVYGIMFSISTRLTLLFLIPLPLLFVIAYLFGVRLEPYFGKIRSARAEMYARIQENLSQMMVVKAFTREPFARQQFQEDNTKVLTAWMRVARLYSLSLPTIWFVVSFLTFLMLFFGGRWVIDDRSRLARWWRLTRMSGCSACRRTALPS